MDHPAANKRNPANGGVDSTDRKSSSSAKPHSSAPHTASTSNSPAFNFISVDPSSRTENSSSRTLIRANAGRYIWKRRKAGSSKESSGRAEPYARPSSQRKATADIKPEPTSTSGGDGQIHALEDLPPVKEEADDERLCRATEKTNTTTAVGPRRRHIRRLDLSSGIHHGLRSPLFTSFGTEVPEDIVRRTFQYSASVVMSKMVPSDGEYPSPKASDVWVASAMRSPALLSAFIYGTLSHEFVLERMQSSAPSKERRRKWLQIMVAESESISRINQALQDPDAQKTDELLMAVFLMGYSRYDEAVFSPNRKPHKSPLHDIQWANIYSFLDYDEVHVMGLIRLLEIRGGIDAVELHGLPEMMSLGTIMFSSKYLHKPLFPYIPIIKSNGRHKQPDWPAPIQYLLRMYTGGKFPKLEALGAPSDLLSLFEDIYSYNAVVELYMQGIFAGSFVGSDAPVMADRRNWIQHRALSLGKADELEIEDTCPAYEALRLTTIIYSLLTIFPLVPVMAPYSQLTTQLRNVLCSQSRGWKSASEYFLWCLVVGGIACTQAETTTWFAATLSQVAMATNLSSWAEVKSVLSSVLWLGPICDDHGEELWRKAVAIRSQVQQQQQLQQQQLHCRSYQQERATARVE